LCWLRRGGADFLIPWVKFRFMPASYTDIFIQVGSIVAKPSAFFSMLLHVLTCPNDLKQKPNSVKVWGLWWIRAIYIRPSK
jgi:undecaprenyl pyrophosphate phosphatase UppP